MQGLLAASLLELLDISNQFRKFLPGKLQRIAASAPAHFIITIGTKTNWSAKSTAI